MSDFSNMLYILRKKHKYTQQFVADKLNINQKTYSNYENGTREPDIQMIIYIANFFDISVDVLIGRYKLNDNSEINKITSTRSKKPRKPRTPRIPPLNEEVVPFRAD